MPRVDILKSAIKEESLNSTVDNNLTNENVSLDHQLHTSQEQKIPEEGGESKRTAKEEPPFGAKTMSSISPRGTIRTKADRSLSPRNVDGAALVKKGLPNPY